MRYRLVWKHHWQARFRGETKDRNPHTAFLVSFLCRLPTNSVL